MMTKIHLKTAQKLKTQKVQESNTFFQKWVMIVLMVTTTQIFLVSFNSKFNGANFLVDIVTTSSDSKLQQLVKQSRQDYFSESANKYSDTGSETEEEERELHKISILKQLVILTHRSFIHLLRKPTLLL